MRLIPASPGGRSLRRRGCRPAATGLVVAVTTAAALLAAAAPAAAHTGLVSVTPAAGATVPAEDLMVRLTFSESINAKLVVVKVSGPGGEVAAAGSAQVDGPNVTYRLTEVPPAGDYRIVYRVVSADGHPVNGESTFGVQAPPVAAPPAVPPAAPSLAQLPPAQLPPVVDTTSAAGSAPQAGGADSSSGSGLPLASVLGAAGVAAGGALVLWRRRTPATARRGT